MTFTVYPIQSLLSALPVFHSSCDWLLGMRGTHWAIRKLMIFLVFFQGKITSLVKDLEKLGALSTELMVETDPCKQRSENKGVVWVELEEVGFWTKTQRFY